MLAQQRTWDFAMQEFTLHTLSLHLIPLPPIFNLHYFFTSFPGTLT